jgi:hypothetical protein
MKSPWNHRTTLPAAPIRRIAGSRCAACSEAPILLGTGELCPAELYLPDLCPGCRGTRERQQAIRTAAPWPVEAGISSGGSSICRHPFHEPLSLDQMVAPLRPEQGPGKRWRRASEEQFSRILHRAASTLLGAAGVERIEAAHWAHAAAAYEVAYAAVRLEAETAELARGQR